MRIIRIRKNNKSLLIAYWAIFSIVLSILLLRSILLVPGLPYTRDLVFPYDLSAAFSNKLSTWDPTHSQRNLETNKIPLFFLLTIGANIVGSENVVKTFFVLVIFLINFVIFVSLYIVFKDKVESNFRLAIICGFPSLLYLLNPWTVDRISNHIFMVLGMALNPLVIILYVRLLEKGAGFLSYFLVAILMTLTCIVSTHNIFYIVPILLVTSLFYAFFATDKRKILSRTGVLFIFFTLVNSYWILPLVYQYSQSSIIPSYIFSIETVERLSELNSPANIFRLIGGGSWDPILQYPPGVQVSVYLSFLMSIFALLALVFYPKNIFVLLLGLLFVTLYLLSLGTNSPIPIFQWLSSSVFAEVIWIYRDPSRVIQYIVLVYSILLAFTLTRLLDLRRTTLRSIREIIVYVVFASIIVSPALYTFVNEAGNRLVSSQPPSQYKQVYDFLNNETGDYKVLWLPLRQYYLYDWNKVPNEVAGDFYTASSPRSTYGLGTQSNPNSTAFLNYLYRDVLLDLRTEEIGRLLNFYNVKYVVVHTDIRGSLLREAQNVLQALDQQKDLRLVAHTDPYYIYENLDYQEHPEKFRMFRTDSQKSDILSFPQLDGTSQSVDIHDQSNWRTVSTNNDLSIRKPNNGSIVRWDSMFNSTQIVSEVRVNMNNINVENFDELKLSVFPNKFDAGEKLYVTLYTNASSFEFSRSDLKPGEWNDEYFDIRRAKSIMANRGQDMNLENVTALGLKTLEFFSGASSSFYIGDISFHTDSRHGRFDTVEILENLSSPGNQYTPARYDDSSVGRYRLMVNSPEPFFLAFTEPYSPLWVASYRENGTNIEKEPIPIFSGTMNGFYINKSGLFEIEIIYKLEDIYHIGAIISVVTLLSALGYVIWRGKISGKLTWKTK